MRSDLGLARLCPACDSQRESRARRARGAVGGCREPPRACSDSASRSATRSRVNAAVRSAPTMAAIDRYTGVLYDALDAASLDASARRWLGRERPDPHRAARAVGALDRIPAYRLGAARVAARARRRCGACGRMPSPRRSADSRRASCSTCARRRTRRSGRCRHPSRRCTCGSSAKATGRRGARAEPLQQARQGSAGARAGACSRPRIGSLRGLPRWADAAGLRAARRRAGRARAVRLTRAQRGRTRARVLGGALGVLRDRDEGDDRLDHEPEDDDREERGDRHQDERRDDAARCRRRR